MKILLTSVFGPYGVDDEYGRRENIMELFHNQVTREQGIFSIRFHHQSFGLYMIAENISAPAVILDFPSEKRFIKEIKKGYDYIGISFIVPNFAKAKRMAELIRVHAPQSKIILGGHGTKIPGVKDMIDHDLFCEGEGVSWFRRLLGEDPAKPLVHPLLPMGFQKRMLGGPIKTTTAVLLPGVGCPNGCPFCATSHFYGKRYIPFFTGKELFDTCLRAEKKFGFTEFGIMDENFLKMSDRVDEFLELIEQHGKRYNFHMFSSAEAIAAAGIEKLVRLGVGFIWIGAESKYRIFPKNREIDLKKMIRELRDHGIAVLASSILFLDEHDMETVWEDIKFVVGMEPDLIQFMQLGPLPGTKLYNDLDAKGLLIKEVPYVDWHGQYRIWFRHPVFTPEQTEKILRDAFRYDYDMLGSSIMRITETAIRGYNYLARYDEPYMIKRREALREQAVFYRPILLAGRFIGHNRRAREKAKRISKEYSRVLGPISIYQFMYSIAVLMSGIIEKMRLSFERRVYQPKTIRTKYRM